MRAQHAGRAWVAACFVVFAGACSEEFSSSAPDAGGGAGGSAGRDGGNGGSAGGSTAGSAGAGGGASGASGVGGGVQDAAADGPSDDYASAVFDDGPAAYWRLNDPENSTTATDAVGVFHGKYTSSVVHPVTGLIDDSSDGAAEFADSATSRIDFGDVLDFPSGAAFSLELWVKAFGNGDDLLLHKATLSQEYGYLIRTTPTGGAFQMKSEQGIAGVPFPKLPLSMTTHLVATYDGSVACVYVNAQKQPCTQVTLVLSDNSLPLRMGQDFSGVIDEVAVYDRALSQTEVSTHYAIGSGN